jgi:uncharacterized phage protein gp47/JayE
MYENLTVENVKSEIIGRMTSDIDTREGSVVNDMISATAYEIWKSYQALDAIIPIAYVDETSGEYIDKRCTEYGIVRKAGKKAAVILTLGGTAGTVIPKAKIFLTADGLAFITNEQVVLKEGITTVLATAEEIGEKYNVEAGTITKQFVNLSGLASVTNEAASGGTDAETDEALVARLYEYLQRPATSGNAHHYKQWALEVDGVGNAKVTPLWDGPGTIRVLIVGNNYEPVDSVIVNNCIDHIEENRPIGATVTVVSAKGLEINVKANITIESKVTMEAVQKAFKEALESYLSGIAFEAYTVVYNRVAYMLLDIDGVVDYTTLTINGGASNVVIGEEQVPILGTVVIA